MEEGKVSRERKVRREKGKEGETRRRRSMVDVR